MNEKKNKPVFFWLLQLNMNANAWSLQASLKSMIERYCIHVVKRTINNHDELYSALGLLAHRYLTAKVTDCSAKTKCSLPLFGSRA
jgi:hypothetical protein